MPDITNRSVGLTSPGNEDEITEYSNSNYSPDRQFNSQRFSPAQIRNNNFVDTSDTLANEGLYIQFESAATFNRVQFKAFVQSYNETFASDYVSEQVFGRIDPIHTFKQVTRNCSLSFVLPAATASEAVENLAKVDILRSILYPTYTSTPNALTINQNPLVRIYVLGVLQALSSQYNGSSDYQELFGPGGSANVAPGALAVINNVTINFNLEHEAGVFITNGSHRRAVPKLIEVSVDFSVIHEINQGQSGSRNAFLPNYGIRYSDSNEDAQQILMEEMVQQELDAERATDAGRTAASQASEDERRASWVTAILGDRTERRQYYALRDMGYNRSDARDLVDLGAAAGGLDFQGLAINIGADPDLYSEFD
jgi:hypothetical protein